MQIRYSTLKMNYEKETEERLQKSIMKYDCRIWAELEFRLDIFQTNIGKNNEII